MRIIPVVGKHSKGHFSVIDDEDFEVLSRVKWTYSLPAPPESRRGLRGGTGYACGKLRDKREGLHRAVASLFHDIEGKVIDHHNGWGLDNRRINLRVGDSALNSQNHRQTNIQPYMGGFRVRFSDLTLPEIYRTKELAIEARDVLAPQYGYVTLSKRLELLQPVIEFIESQVRSGVVRNYIQDAPLIEDRYRLRI